jgi:hypothetical protein
MSDDLEPTETEREPDQAVPRWRKYFLFGAGTGATIGAAIAVVATLVTTHKRAVTENAIAFVNGEREGWGYGHDAGWDSGWNEGYAAAIFDDTYCCTPR